VKNSGKIVMISKRIPDDHISPLCHA
jgi:hypothetical protein